MLQAVVQLVGRIHCVDNYFSDLNSFSNVEVLENGITVAREDPNISIVDIRKDRTSEKWFHNSRHHIN